MNKKHNLVDIGEEGIIPMIKTNGVYECLKIEQFFQIYDSKRKIKQGIEIGGFIEIFE